MARFLLQVHHHIDGINAVEVQILVKTCLRGNILRGDFKQRNKKRRDFLINRLLFCHSGHSQARC
ncbi:Uncharacterised protein [Enterobacter cloacae]|nr:Uncharacterised protein [Enterobacter cloacae]